MGITEFRSCMNTTEALKVISGFYANTIILDIWRQGMDSLYLLKQDIRKWIPGTTRTNGGPGKTAYRMTSGGQ